MIFWEGPSHLEVLRGMWTSEVQNSRLYSNQPLQKSYAMLHLTTNCKVEPLLWTLFKVAVKKSCGLEKSILLGVNFSAQLEKHSSDTLTWKTVKNYCMICQFTYLYFAGCDLCCNVLLRRFSRFITVGMELPCLAFNCPFITVDGADEILSWCFYWRLFSP